MPTRIKAAKATLNKYEAEQVREIAAWKSLPPNPLSELWNTLVAATGQGCSEGHS